MWQRQIQRPTCPGGRELRQVDRLRIVHEDDVRLQVQPLGILPIHLVVQIEVALPQSDTGRPCKPLWKALVTR